MSWHWHPRVRSGSDLTLGERAADRMRNGMGSWGFVFGALGYLGLWILIAEFRWLHIDNPQLTILNLVLSCVAALQGAILLIAAKRQDQIASELARHDYRVNTDSLRYHIAVSQLLVQLADAAGHTIDPALREQLLAPPSVPLPPIDAPEGVV